MRQKLPAFLLTIFFFLHSAGVALAAEPAKFSVSYDINYEIEKNGLTKVTQNAHLTNLTSEYYATQYVSRLGNANLENVRAYDRLGPLKIVTTGTDEGRKITVSFNDRVYGRGKTLNWTLVFETKEIALHNGRIWEINIPKPSNLENITDYNVTLNVPKGIGNLLYAKPEPAGGINPPRDFYFWNRDLIKDSGISVAFGDYQVYNFILQYHLANLNFSSDDMEIALPPETGYQHVVLENLNPAPFDVYVDPDGNWLAKYRLSAGQKLDIEASGQVQTFLFPRRDLSAPTANFSAYTYSQKYWETNNPLIRQTAQKLRTPENIYNFVSKTLHYDTGRVENNLGRVGALGAITHPESAICMEFTDLFIALARAAGIPAREVNGFAFTADNRRQPLSLKKDILHAWPEYFDGQNWVMVDPTWGNTTGGIDYFHTFDLDHVTFAVQGIASTKPEPAGGYKITGKEKDVTVTPAPALYQTAPAASLAVGNNFPAEVISGLPVNGKILVSNSGPVLVRGNKITLASADFFLSPSTITVPDLPPFARRAIPVSFRTKNALFSGKGIIALALDGNNFQVVVISRPFYENKFIAGFAAILIFGSLGVWAVAKFARHLPLFRPGG